ncbi:thiolase family protein [Sphingobium fuliginis]|uniref:propanoyl-CoA C-acyltransferase n=1 Tax=Sphingobium fuliginis (strain ATCC 27551) TaxID=336203 RepID=A0A292ZH18_SPHSA|nr:thiolase family protein [Sphingobium fuliginis]GAY22226.1 putative thiolase [Sphingobium fuliginis]
MSNVHIVGAGMTPLGKHLDKSVKQLTAEAVDAALADAGIAREAIEAAWFCNTRQGALEGQHGVRGQASLRAYGFEGIPIFNTDNACASSSSGLYQAFAAVKAGLHDIAIVVGAEKMNYPEKRKEMFEAFKGSWDRELADDHIARLLATGEALPLPPEAVEPSGERSVFMDIYAAQARAHMHRFGTTQRQIAAVAAKNHTHSVRNPVAQYRFPMTVDEVLNDRLIIWPVTRAMCAPMSDGAAALIVASDAAVARLGLASRAVRVRGIGVSSSSNRSADQYDRHLTRVAADRCYAMAGVGPEDIDVGELHDASAIAEILHSENVGFCAYGEGGALVESGATTLGGRLPINVSGGLLSKGHPIGATGAIQIVELVTQLRGEGGDRQVEGARFGLAENGGGFHGLEEAACVVTILEGQG